jgi:hypothetical protein
MKTMNTKEQKLRKIIREELKLQLNENNEDTGIIQKHLKDIGLGNIKTPKELPEDNKWVKLKPIKIDVKKLGAISSIYTSMTMEPKFGKDDMGNLYIDIDYQWEHPYGSNGYHICHVYIKKKNQWSLERRF